MAQLLRGLRAISRWYDRQCDWFESRCRRASRSLRRGIAESRFRWERRQASKVASRPGVRQLLGRGGWTMLVLFAARLFTTMLPYRLVDPDWYVKLGLELVNSSPVMLTGFALLASVGILNYRAKQDQQPRRAAARVLLQAAVVVYVLLIPVQVVASVLTDRNFQVRLGIQWVQVQQQLETARQRQLSGRQLEQLQELERQLLDRRDQGSRQLRLTLFRDALRVVVSALALVWALRLPLVVLDDKRGLP
jgi:hypothetical protein